VAILCRFFFLPQGTTTLLRYKFYISKIPDNALLSYKAYVLGLCIFLIFLVKGVIETRRFSFYIEGDE